MSSLTMPGNSEIPGQTRLPKNFLQESPMCGCTPRRMKNLGAQLVYLLLQLTEEKLHATKDEKPGSARILACQAWMEDQQARWAALPEYFLRSEL